jgi:hypothetical protein
MKVYKSKISLVIILPIIILFVYSLYNCIIYNDLIVNILLLILFLTILYLIFNIIYTIENQNLNVKFGFLFNKNIDVNKISKISETNDLSSSPAASIDRLEILYNKYETVLVSPKDKKGFIQSLLVINPNIELVYRKKWSKL